MIVTESTWVSPMDYQNEVPFLVSAYQSLAGIAGYYWFTAKSEQYDDDPRFPFVEGEWRASAVQMDAFDPRVHGRFSRRRAIYRNGYLKRGQPVVVENRPLADLCNRLLLLISKCRIRSQPNAGPAAAAAAAQTGVDPLAFLVGPVTVNYGVAGQTTVADLSRYIHRQRKIISSNTGEIRLDHNTGLCTIDAPCAEANWLFECRRQNTFEHDLHRRRQPAGIGSGRLPGMAGTLNELRRILVQVGTPSHLSGWTRAVADFGGNDKNQYHGFRIVKIGKPPWMIENADVTLTIRNIRLTKATALDAAGYPAKQSSLAPDGTGVELRFPRRQCTRFCNRLSDVSKPQVMVFCRTNAPRKAR